MNLKKISIKNWLLFIGTWAIIYCLFGAKAFFKLITSIIFSLGVVVIIFLGYYLIKFLIKRFYPMDEFGPVEAYAMRNSTFEFYRMLSGILIPLGGLVGGILSYKALIWLSKLWLRQLSGVFIVTFEEIFWSIPALLIGILFGSLFSSIVFRIILRDQYKLYINRYDLGLGINAKKLARSMIFVCIILILLSSYVNLVSYTRFTEEGIYIHRAYQFSEQQYLYSEVEKIEEQIRMQKDSSHYTFLITFTDGRKWQPMSVEDSYLSQNYARILEFVSQKSGRPLNQIKTTIKKDDE